MNPLAVGDEVKDVRSVVFVCLLFCTWYPSVFAQERKYSVNVDVELVLVNVAVTDAKGQPVTRLEKHDFTVFEGKVEQNISLFRIEDLPVSIGLIFDVSGSMESKVSEAKAAAVAFLKTTNLQDEFCLLTFADQPRVEVGFTQDVSKIENRLESVHPLGSTALYDAVYLCLARMRHGHNPRKVILLITDGEETGSRYSFVNIREALKESDIQIYAIGITKSSYVDFTVDRSHSILEYITYLTGGNAYFLTSVSQLEDTCLRIAEELKKQYVLGYISTNPLKDGRWRKIKVKLNLPKASNSLSIHSKAGYYAPQR